jgi:glycosyltransferase involved in cell wall biosynthesis
MFWKTPFIWELIISCMPFISVIIPFYNRKALLPRALKSVLEQSCTDFEVILVDDCSTEDVSDLHLLFDDKRIHYIRLPQRSGVSKARNEGVRLAKGEWIAFLDSDDEWLKNKLAIQKRWISTHAEYKIVQTNEIWIRNGTRVNAPRTHEKFEGDLFEASLDRCMITPSSVSLTRKLFDQTGGFNESLPACEDYDLWLRICSNLPVGLINELLLIRYGGHTDQLSSTVTVLDRFRIRSILQLLEHTELLDFRKMQAIVTLKKKATLVANGYLKRGNQELYERYTSIINRFN